MAATPFVREPAGHWRVWALTALLVAASGGAGVRAQPASGDAAAKAKFTITLARFAHWPTSASAGVAAPLKLCVLHNSAAVGAAFAQLDGQPVAGHPVSVLANPRDRGACMLLFVDASAAHASADAITAAASAPLLTLGAVDGFLSQGGMVELANVNDALRFDVNLKALRQARLDLSSQVLKLARQVRD